MTYHENITSFHWAIEYNYQVNFMDIRGSTFTSMMDVTYSTPCVLNEDEQGTDTEINI